MRELTSLDDFAHFLTESETKALFLFKHSTACPISAGAFQKYQAFLSKPDQQEHAFVKVIEHKAISNEIENLTGVRHESPQVLLISHGKVLWHASHRAITETTLQTALQEFENAQGRT